jgi:hypothetical protein
MVQQTDAAPEWGVDLVKLVTEGEAEACSSMSRSEAVDERKVELAMD